MHPGGVPAGQLAPVTHCEEDTIVWVIVTQQTRPAPHCGLPSHPTATVPAPHAAALGAQFFGVPSENAELTQHTWFGVQLVQSTNVPAPLLLPPLLAPLPLPLPELPLLLPPLPLPLPELPPFAPSLVPEASATTSGGAALVESQAMANHAPTDRTANLCI